MIDIRRTGILGGTFDPIHVGHLVAAKAAQAALRLDQIRIVPAHDPPHRVAQPCASGYHRFAMAALAIADHPEFVVSDIELASDIPSFTVTTLRRLHALGHTAVELFFIIGSDAFAEIATWRDYPAVLDLCHFAVISRSTLALAALESRLPDLAPRMRTVGSGHDVERPAEAVTSPSIFLVQQATPDVSSTEIRDRAREARPLAGLVPRAVEDYIARHGLYRASAPPRPFI
jgi:nicotinate-nucleotide adenylyltransferase